MFVKLMMAVGTVLILSSCDVAISNFPADEGSGAKISDPVAGNITVIPLTAANVKSLGIAENRSGGRTSLKASGPWNYHVGTGDLLDIVVWDHPELTMPAGANRTPIESGLRVQADGTFFYPYVGQIRARGLTPEDIRADLAMRLQEFIPKPQVSVRVVGYNSQAVSVTGEVGKPTRIPLTALALTLLDAVNDAGGLTEKADARLVTVRRGGRSYRVDLQAFLGQGVAENNPVLRDGDVVVVPRAKMMEAYLIGQLVKPGAIDLTRDEISLTEAVSTVGGLRLEQADARGVFVFRDTPSGISVYQLDTSNAAAFVTGTHFYLHPQDVVYVTTAPVAKWNRVISNLLPTLTTARAATTLGN